MSMPFGAEQVIIKLLVHLTLHKLFKLIQSSASLSVIIASASVIKRGLKKRCMWVAEPKASIYMLVNKCSIQFSSVAQLCLTVCDPMNRKGQASLSITNSQSLLKLMSIKSVMPSSHPILYSPLLLLPPINVSCCYFKFYMHI